MGLAFRRHEGDMQNTSEVGVVVIGRNEGERLRRCFQSLAGWRTVYVDSGSRDDSVRLAREMGVEAIELDPSRPFTAARGRSEGFQYLARRYDDISYIQFVDGDCEVVDGWMMKALEVLDERKGVAVVCGRVRERYPNASLYNYLQDLDWNDPVGKVSSSGGIAMMRVDALLQVGGWREELIAGEEPDLCYRLRQAGWAIERVPDMMVYHDSAMTYFSEWWRRCRRTGYAYGLGFLTGGSYPGAFRFKKILSILFWSLVVPMMAVLYLVSGQAWIATGIIALAAIFMLRNAVNEQRHRQSWRDSLIYSTTCLVAKTPQMVGLIQVFLDYMRGMRRGLIE
jgi:GT2 family glycosyltransferase